jgi:hypothetical protein
VPLCVRVERFTTVDLLWECQGHGVYTWANGAKYDGEYKDNKKNGHGLHTWPDGSMYEGTHIYTLTHMLVSHVNAVVKQERTGV